MSVSETFIFGKNVFIKCFYVPDVEEGWKDEGEGGDGGPSNKIFGKSIVFPPKKIKNAKKCWHGCMYGCSRFSHNESIKQKIRKYSWFQENSFFSVLSFN